jgi:hypothetical protein
MAIVCDSQHFNLITIFQDMLIEEQALKHWIDNFYGYGSWKSKFWFIGYEEGGGNLPEEVADKLNYFAANHPSPDEPALCDLRDVYRHVAFRDDGPKAEAFSNRYQYRFGANPVQNNIWKNLTAFVHGYENRELPDLLTYQRDHFAQPMRGKEALIQFYPLPSPHNHAWYYSWLEAPTMPFLKSRKRYEEELYEKRVNAIFSQIKKYKPEVALMYGMNNINSIKQSGQEIFPGASFKLVKQIKLQIPQHHIAHLAGTILIITTQIPALRHNRVETGFDWQMFGQLTKKAASS